MRKHVRWILAGVVMLLFIGGMIIYPLVKKSFQSDELSGPGGSPGGGQRNRALNINAVVIKHQSFTDNTRTVADILPDEEVDLSFEASGKITDIFFTEGSHVNKGDLLAKINDKPLQAELRKLLAQIPLAEQRVSRQRTLLERDAVSLEAFETVNTELEKLQADIELVTARILQTELRAPFDGIVGLRNVSEGAYANPSTVITKLTKIKPLKIDFPIPEQYSEDIVPGTNIIFRLTGSSEDYHAQVYAIESKVDINTRGLRARAYYANTNESIKPGRYASVELTKKEIRDAMAVPSESIIQEMGRSIVYLYKSGVAHPAEIITGLRTSSQVQVLEGINVGDTVIISGVMQLRTGLPVTIDNIQ